MFNVYSFKFNVHKLFLNFVAAVLRLNMDTPFDYDSSNQAALIDRFEKMLSTNDHLFFDVEEFEALCAGF